MGKCHQPTILDEFNKFFTVFDGNCQARGQVSLCEGLSISEDEEKFYIDASLAGVKSEEIQVNLDPKSRHLFILGQGKHNRDKVNYLMKGSLSYCYEIPLSNEVDLDSKIDAVSKDGILSITLSKNRGHKPLKIDVRMA